MSRKIYHFLSGYGGRGDCFPCPPYPLSPAQDFLPDVADYGHASFPYLGTVTNWSKQSAPSSRAAPPSDLLGNSQVRTQCD